MSDDRQKDLPVTPGQAYRGDDHAADDAAASGAAGTAGPAFEADAGPGPELDEVPAWRLVSTLAVAGALAGLLIVGVFQWAQPQILEHRATVLSDAIQNVLAQPDHYQTLFVQDGRLVPEAPAGVDTIQAEKVYLGYDENDRPVGYAIVGAEPGFQDVIQLIFGYDPAEDRVLGMQILESKETPGLGDKIYKDQAFVAEFDGVVAPIQGVKPGAGSGDEDEVDMITGATISSRTVIAIINHRVEALEGMLKAYIGGSTAAAEGVAP